MNFWLISYLVVYSVMTIAGIYADIKSKYSIWWILLDIFSGIGLLIGMLLVVMHVDDPLVMQIWRPLSVAMVVALFAVMGIDAYDECRAEAEEPRRVATVTIATFIFEIPAIAVNLLYAFNFD